MVHRHTCMQAKYPYTWNLKNIFIKGENCAKLLGRSSEHECVTNRLREVLAISDALPHTCAHVCAYMHICTRNCMVQKSAKVDSWVNFLKVAFRAARWGALAFCVFQTYPPSPSLSLFCPSAKKFSLAGDWGWSTAVKYLPSIHISSSAGQTSHDTITFCNRCQN